MACAAQLNNISQAQLGHLLAQLLSSLNNKDNCSTCNYFKVHFKSDMHWVIDSGATYHMTGNPGLLQNKIKANNYQPVTMANGFKIPIDQISTTNILSNNIPGVLYLSDFTSIFLSVSKIIKELNCHVIFSPTNVIFQDIITKKTIGEGKLDNDLYYLDFSNKALTVKNVENKLWHWRLGHASDVVLNN
jgi:hypothetical protein